MRNRCHGAASVQGIGKSLLRFGALGAATMMYGCSGSSAADLGGAAATSCGSGTYLRGGACVPADPSRNDAGPTSADGSTTDPDGALEDATRVDGSAAPTSDPCPVVAAVVNCSTTCGGPSANCVLAGCGGDVDGPNTTKLSLRLTTLDPVVIRTPALPAPCTHACGAFPQYSFALALRIMSPAGAVRVRVEPPWFVRSTNTPWCDSNGAIPMAQCEGVSGNESVVTIATHDPSAPSRNVELQVGQSCP